MKSYIMLSIDRPRARLLLRRRRATGSMDAAFAILLVKYVQFRWNVCMMF